MLYGITRLIAILPAMACLALGGCGVNDEAMSETSMPTRGEHSPAKVEPVVATIGGASARGIIAILGEGVISAVRNSHPHSNIVYEPGSPAGSLVAVAEGKLEFALASSVEINMAQRGIEPFPKAYGDQIKAVVVLAPHLINLRIYARAAFLDKHDIHSFADIKARHIPVRLVILPAGNVYGRAQVKAVLGYYGITLEDIVDWGGRLVRQNTDVAHDLMKDGRVDIIITGGFNPSGSLKELASTVPIRFIPLPREAAEAMASELQGEVRTIPAGTYDFQEGELHVPVATYAIVAGSAATDEQSYAIASSVNKEIAEFQSLHPAFRSVNRQTLVPTLQGLSIHPGALQFYRESGLLPP